MDPCHTESYTLSLHDALPICFGTARVNSTTVLGVVGLLRGRRHGALPAPRTRLRSTGRSVVGLAASLTLVEVSPYHQKVSRDRKSTRLNSSHLGISYAVFCLK